MNYFSFGGVSSGDYGLYITGEPYGSPEKDVTMVEVPGRSGDLSIDDQRFKNQSVHYEAYVRNRLAVRARAIKAWLLAPDGYQVLEDTYDRDYFRYAMYAGPLEIAQTLQRFGKMDIAFNCKPFLYSKAGRRPHTMSATGYLYNPEAFSSEPYIRVAGSGTGRLFINNKTITLNSISGYVELDTEMQQCFRGFENKSGTMIGDFPVLLKGKNLIQWDGGITGLTITPRWRTT